jgi:tetratricopeptide (TPR) repeat protein
MAQITLRDYLQEAEDAIRDDRIDDAFTHCQNILAQFPESLEAQRLLGEAYLAHGQLEDAQQSFDWILTNDPENVVAYCSRALISERSLDYDTALDCYQQAYELSHGNSHIRQEFNRLSTETGPQGFMFSRAGLARLYMRGDLLTQAIQEWEAVLAVSPDRLDARVGLLETCWRESHFDRVEQLAAQILRDVPGCLKALLLLAYVTSAKNVQRAQELLKRAEALDPDLLMAQELFSTFMARQPAEPFLQLLKKAPATVETGPRQSVVTPSVANLQDALSQSTNVSVSPMPAQAFAAWNDAAWASTENDVTLIKAEREKQLQPEPAALPVWSNEEAPTLDVWGALDVSQEAASLHTVTGGVNSPHYDSLVQPPIAPPQSEGQSLAPWPSDSSLNMPLGNSQREAEFASWDSPHLYEDLPAQSLQSADAWENMPGSMSESGMWGTSAQGSSMPSPPAWLNQLTQSERQQLNDGDVPEPSPVEIPMPSMPAARPPVETPVASNVVDKPPVASVPPMQSPAKEEAKVVTGPFFADDDEPLSFGPEWLKSMGAASLHGIAATEEASPVLESPLAVTHETEQEWLSHVAPSYEPQPAPYDPPVYEPQKPSYEPQLGYEQSVYEPQKPLYEPQPVGYEQSIYEPQKSLYDEKIAEPAGMDEHNLLATLEGLEAGLLSQGFVPLQPNSLQAIAKTQEEVSTTVPKTPELAMQQEDVYQNEPFSSALTELGGFVQEPSWLASLSAMSMPSPLPELPQETMVQQGQEQAYATFSSAQPSWSVAYEPHVTSPLSSVEDEVREEVEEGLVQPTVVHPAQATRPLPGVPVWSQRQEPAREEELLVSPIYGTAQQDRSQMDRLQEIFATSAPVPPARAQVGAQNRAPSSDFLLNNELEATMKRPAVRLQAMQQERSFIQNEPAISPVRPRTVEPTPTGRAPEGNISYQDRLLKGYQHQLAGDYDEAMQEYRIVIRNSYELLSEVVSNMRALLKLAPKYSTGYRVLGDAYMRQGEYLQAMEAYNKALTMAKRAKG